MNVCPMCQQVVSGDLLTVKLDANTVVYHGCLPCWDTKVLGQDPIRRALWNFAAKHLQRQPQRKGIDKLLEESGGAMTADIALRVVEFAQATKNPKASLSDLIAAERHAKMKDSVVVGGLMERIKAKQDGEKADAVNGQNEDPAPEGQ